MNIENIYKIFLRYPSISTDSRNIINNSIFWALKGEKFDGNKFVENALKSGASYAVSDNKKNKAKDQIIYVENSLKALQSLANYHRNQLNIKIIAITGTNGKTTTKELTAKVLSSKFNVSATKGNFNNHIGVPLTLLSFIKNTEFGIVEMGANHPGEIQSLCKIAEPDFGLITNIGKAHLEGFGSFEKLINTKAEMYEYLAKDGSIFINENNKLLKSLIKDHKIISYGTQNNVFCKAKLISSDPFVSLDLISGKKYRINSRLIGHYNFENISAALCIGLYFNVEPEKIKYAIESYFPVNNRSQLIKKGKSNIISDAYNANPTSMKIAVENFMTIKSKSKVMILGDMFELGKFSEEEHDNTLKRLIDIKKNNPEIMIFLAGKNFYSSCLKHKISGSIHYFKSPENLSNYIKDKQFNKSWFLIKGSRGMKLEELIVHLNIS